MALACLAETAELAGARLARQGYVLLDGTAVSLKAAVAGFDALRADAEGAASLACNHPLVRSLLEQETVRELLAEVFGDSARPLTATAFDRALQLPQSWHQPEYGLAAAEKALVLRWHLDLIGPADGALRVLPGSHTNGRLSSDEIARLATEVPAVELAVSGGTVVALRPRLVQGARRRTTRGHRRILEVLLTSS
jgi:hypothetical protein